MKLSRVLILTLALAILVIPVHADEKIGVILMHGKMGSSSTNSPVGELADALESEGFIVLSPNMPWSGDREFDKSYEESMYEIDGMVEDLKSKGATKIVVGGHSIGANAALGYGARREGLAGILAIAPGHVPEISGYQQRIDNDWQRAKKMVDSGQGDESEYFKDKNQKKVSEIKMKASIYLSWFNPEGPAVIPANTKNLKPNTPLLWIIGEKDNMYDRGKEYAFESAPSNPKNAYIVVKGGHKVTPQKGEAEIISWLKSL